MNDCNTQLGKQSMCLACPLEQQHRSPMVNSIGWKFMYMLAQWTDPSANLAAVGPWVSGSNSRVR